MEPILALAIQLPEKGSRQILRDLHRQLQRAIIDGRLCAGLRLPATRNLAIALGISRNTTIAAYDLLLSEGYLVARPGAGTYVADALRKTADVRTSGTGKEQLSARTPDSKPGFVRKDRLIAAPDHRLVAFWREDPPFFDAWRGPPMRFDFQLGLPDRSSFPQHIWRRLASRSLQQFGREPVGYGRAAGSLTLREAIARHVAYSRAVACDAQDIIVTAGAQQAFDLLARILVTAGTSVAVEQPGYPPVRNIFAAAGAKLAGVPVDHEGIDVARIPPDARVICVTPSHQFPLGVPMSLRRRAALLDHAGNHDAVIIEDDYDSEFRFDGQPLDALQTLDRNGRVFYVGTFSKSLFPELRIGYVVAPAWAHHALMAAKQLVDWHNPLLLQETLAAFIAEGHLARHVRKMRRLYAARRETLIEAIVHHCGEALRPIPSMAGLHLAAALPARKGKAATDAMPLDQHLAQAARAQELRFDYASRYLLAPASAKAPSALVFGYGQITEAAIEPAIRRLAKLLQA